MNVFIIRIWEGLGNQLFQYAFARALQLSRGEKVYLDFTDCNGRLCDQTRTAREYQLSNFRITLRNYPDVAKYFFFLDESNEIKKGIKCLAEKKMFPYKYYEEENVQYKPELLGLKGNYYIQGWFQNQGYFMEYADVIRKEIRLKNKIYLENELKSILKNRNAVSVHIRRGDYKKNTNVLTMRYYEKAINQINNSVKKPVFCVFSDEIDWVKKNLEIEGEVYYVNENRSLADYEELMVMSHCKHHIIANSTYSWWGAWLNENKDKIVIGPKVWFLNSHSINAGLNIMPPEWIRL